MCNSIIFVDSKGKKYTYNNILETLKRIGADEADMLFIHTDIMFGRPNPQLGRRGYLRELYNVLMGLGVKTLVFPSFSYSFCNGENYDVRNSRTSMGALIEYIRKQPGAYRSLDPILSMVAVGKGVDFLKYDIGHNALGKGSGFDLLHNEKNVKFLFFGADFSECFTYIHHIEKVLDVPYRYDQYFSGSITDYNGHSFTHEHSIHTACGGVKLKNFHALKKSLEKEGYLQVSPLGDLEIACISEKNVYKEVTRKIKENPFSFVYPYKNKDLTHNYTFGKDGERVTHC